jgi:hypothetical protein
VAWLASKSGAHLGLAIAHRSIGIGISKPKVKMSIQFEGLDETDCCAA